MVAKNTLASRLIRYHIYVKRRSPICRFDQKLTLADQLGVNEIMYEDSYPGNDTLKQNPLASDRIAISKLTRRQRNNLVRILVNILIFLLKKCNFTRYSLPMRRIQIK